MRPAYHAFVYSDGTMTDLKTLIGPSIDWTLMDAEAPNNLGQIVGQGTDPSGHYEAYLMTPTPEQGSLVMLAVGGAGLLLRRRPWARR